MWFIVRFPLPKQTFEKCFHNFHKKNRLLSIDLIISLKLTYYGKQLNSFP